MIPSRKRHRGMLGNSRMMVGVVLGPIFLAGCGGVTTSSSDLRLARFDREIGAVADREDRCRKEAQATAADELSQTGSAPDALSNPNRQTVQGNYYNDIRLCEAEADRESRQLSAREREEYRLEQQQERDRVLLMTTLMASRPH